MKAFFSRQLDAFVVNEMCECGHLKTDHGSKLHRRQTTMIREPNGGNCCSSDCACDRFTFARFVTADEAARLVLDQRPVLV